MSADVAPQRPRVLKTTVTCEVGFSVQTGSGDWEKSGVTVSSEVGPGYPSPQGMSALVRRQMDDAVAACNAQIEQIARKVIKEAQR